MVAQQHQDFLTVLHPHFDTPESRRLPVVRAAQHDDFILEDGAIFRDRPRLQHTIVGVVAQASHKEHTAIGEPLIPLVVHIAAVKDQDGAGGKLPITRYFHFGSFSFREDRITRQMPIVIQNQVQLRRAFGLLVLGPVKHGGAEVDEGTVDAQQWIAKTETVSCPCCLLATSKQNAENLLIQLPGPVLIGIGERGFVGRPSNAEMLQFSFATRQPAANLAQRTSLPQLAKQHGHELAPAGKSAGMALCTGLSNCLFKFQARKELQQLRKNAAYSVQGGISCPESWFSSRNPTNSNRSFRLFPKT